MPGRLADPGVVLFRSRNLLVRQVGGFGGACCVVTFASFTDDRTLERDGFGEGFLRSRRIDAVHVISRDNDWYQYPETLAAMERVRAAVRDYARVVTYGSSMGAYAAIRLAGVAGAHCALALSPQFSVLAETVPFEYRWAVIGRQLRPVWEKRLPLPELAEAYALYDPLNLDGRHAELFGPSCFTHVRLRGAGHPVTGFLLETGLLQGIVLAACRGTLDARAIERDAWQRRRRSAQYLVMLAARVRLPAWRIALLQRATALAPGNAAILGKLGLALGQAGRFSEALAAHGGALALHPGQASLLDEQAATLEASGDLAGALAVLEQAAARTGEPFYARRLARLRAQLGGQLGSDAAAPDAVPSQRVRGQDPGIVPAPGTEPLLTGRGQQGFVLFGPFIELRPGRYAVEFGVAARPDAEGGALRRLLEQRTGCILDVCIHGGRTVLARRRVSVARLRAGNGRFTLPFTMPEWTACEFRVFATGGTGLVVQPQRPCRRVGSG